MSTIEDALRSRLIGDAAIFAIVDARVYPLKMPDNPQLPCITYQRISTSRGGSQSMDIRDAGRKSLTDAYFQIDSWADDFDMVADLAAKILSCLEGFRGLTLGVNIQAILSENEIDFFEPDEESRRRSQSFRITFIEG